MYKSAARNAQHRANFAKEPRRRIKYEIPISVVLANKSQKIKRKRRNKRKAKAKVDEEHVTYYSGPRSANMERVIVQRKKKSRAE